jgi:hypothetical protein
MKVSRFLATLVVGITALVLASDIFAQAQQKPVYTGYKGVMIGTSMADARAKLGDPRDKSDTEDYYVFSDHETAQVFYDTDKTVKLISVNYVGAANAPKPVDVLGMDIETKPDGSMQKVIKYPKAGFSISYLRTAGDDPLIMITVQKLAGEQ